MFPEKIDRFADAGIAKFNVRNDDAVQLVGHLRRAAQFAPSPFVVSNRTHSAVFSDRLLPGRLHFPHLAGACFVVRFLAVLIFSVVDFLLPSTRGGIVWIERQDLVVTLHGLVVLPGLIKTVGFGEQAFYIFDFVDEAGIDRFVEVAGCSQMRVEFLRLTAVGIVMV